MLIGREAAVSEVRNWIRQGRFVTLLGPGGIDKTTVAVRAAPAVSRAKCANKSAHEHTGSAEAFRPSLRNGFTAYFVLSPVNGSFATVAAQDIGLARLDASTAASGPHDFAVRVTHARLLRIPRPPHPTARS